MKILFFMKRSPEGPFRRGSRSRASRPWARGRRAASRDFDV